MATTSTKEHDSARQVDQDTLQSLNLKVDNNLDDYVLLIVGMGDDHCLSEYLPRIIHKHCINWFNDIEASLTFIHSLQNMSVFLIISGNLGRDHAHLFLVEKRLVGLYVYCRNEDEHRMWTKDLNKIRCTASNPKKLLTQVYRDIKELSGRWPLGEESFQKAATSASQWYHLFLLVICYRSEFIEESYEEMFNECRAYYRNNRSRLEQINRFQQTYKSDNAIHEYTRDSFLYRIVNHALRTKNMEIIRKFSPFIRDLHHQLHNCHHKYYSSKSEYIRAVYRGQNLSVDEVEYLRTVSKSNNPVILLTTFGSASLDPDVALSFVSSVNGRIPCLFEISIPDSYNENQEYIVDYDQTFANIASLSDIPEEQEVLFSLATRFSVKHVGYPISQFDRTWVPIVLRLTSLAEVTNNRSHFDTIKQIGTEKDPTIHNDILHMLQMNADDELKFKSTNWQNWWNSLKKHSGKGLGLEQPLHLIFYDCFTEDKYWSRKAIELHKGILRTIPHVQSNATSFPGLLREFNVWYGRPTIQIAIYEDYLKPFCTMDTKEVVTCLWLAGESYQNISDTECASECYQKALDMNVDDKYHMNGKIRERMKMLQKPRKTRRTTDDTNRRLVKKDPNSEIWEMYEVQRDLGLLSTIMRNKVAAGNSVEERLRELSKYIRKREECYDTVDSKIILRFPNKVTEDLSVIDYRYNFLTAVHRHISSGRSPTDAANNTSLSLWRYRNYMYEWMLCKELERSLQSFQNKSKYIRFCILPQLERFIKKLHVLAAICTVYLCIEQGENNVNVDSVQLANKANPAIRHAIYVDLHDRDLLAGLELFDDKSGETEEIAQHYSGPRQAGFIRVHRLYAEFPMKGKR